MLLLMFNALVYGRKAVEGEGLRLRALRFMSFASPPPPLPYSSFVFHALSAFLSAAKLALGLT
jgi:hypothetical protein